MRENFTELFFSEIVFIVVKLNVGSSLSRSRTNSHSGEYLLTRVFLVLRGFFCRFVGRGDIACLAKYHM